MGAFWVQKIIQKIDKIHKDFGLYAVMMYNFVSQSIQIFAIYIFLTRRINTFWSKVLISFAWRHQGI